MTVNVVKIQYIREVFPGEAAIYTRTFSLILFDELRYTLLVTFYIAKVFFLVFWIPYLLHILGVVLLSF